MIAPSTYEEHAQAVGTVLFLVYSTGDSQIYILYCMSALNTNKVTAALHIKCYLPKILKLKRTLTSLHLSEVPKDYNYDCHNEATVELLLLVGCVKQHE